MIGPSRGALMSSPQFPTYGRGDDPDEPSGDDRYAKPAPYGPGAYQPQNQPSPAPPPSYGTPPPDQYGVPPQPGQYGVPPQGDRKSTRLNSSHANISYAVFC